MSKSATSNTSSIDKSKEHKDSYDPEWYIYENVQLFYDVDDECCDIEESLETLQSNADKNKRDIAFLEAEISTFIGTYHGNVSNNSSVDNDTELSVDEILHDAAIIISDLTTENIKLKQIIHNIMKYLM
eukprot:360691_1